MACLSEDSWLCLAQKLSAGTALKEGEVEEKEENFGSKPAEYQLEQVFPVYAVGILEPDPKLVGSVAKRGCKPGDPIWEAVREEAKLEVICSFLDFLFYKY